jgi:hypothetical protein
MELKLMRTYFPKGTNGILYDGAKKICNTIELPWRNNQKQVSCIPQGRYELKMRLTPRFGAHFWLQNVPGRSMILLHAFNDALKESKGCIAPVSRITGEGQGTFSRVTLEELVKLVYPELEKSKPVYLTIQS